MNTELRNFCHVLNPKKEAFDSQCQGFGLPFLLQVLQAYPSNRGLYDLVASQTYGGKLPETIISFYLVDFGWKVNRNDIEVDWNDPENTAKQGRSHEI